MLTAEILRVIFGLLAVIGMIGIVALGARKAGLATISSPLNRKRRLSIVETLAIDARRRFVIIKCDDTEHLILLGANGETIIENNLAGAPDIGAETPLSENPFPTLAGFAQKLRQPLNSKPSEAA